MLKLLGPRPPIDPFEAVLVIVDAMIVLSLSRLVVYLVLIPFAEAILEWVHPSGRFYF